MNIHPPLPGTALLACRCGQMLTFAEMRWDRDADAPRSGGIPRVVCVRCAENAALDAQVAKESDTTAEQAPDEPVVEEREWWETAPPEVVAELIKAGEDVGWPRGLI